MLTPLIPPFIPPQIDTLLSQIVAIQPKTPTSALTDRDGCCPRRTRTALVARAKRVYRLHAGADVPVDTGEPWLHTLTVSDAAAIANAVLSCASTVECQAELGYVLADIWSLQMWPQTRQAARSLGAKINRRVTRAEDDPIKLSVEIRPDCQKLAATPQVCF